MCFVGINQSIFKEINPEYSLEGLMLKLKLQYFGQLMGTANSLEKTLMLGKIEGRRRGNRGWDAGWHHQCNGHEIGQTLGDGEGQGGLACCSPWGFEESNMTGWLNNNTPTFKLIFHIIFSEGYWWNPLPFLSPPWIKNPCPNLSVHYRFSSLGLSYLTPSASNHPPEFRVTVFTYASICFKN